MTWRGKGENTTDPLSPSRVSKTGQSSCIWANVDHLLRRWYQVKVNQYLLSNLANLGDPSLNLKWSLFLACWASDSCTCVSSVHKAERSSSFSLSKPTNTKKTQPHYASHLLHNGRKCRSLTLLCPFYHIWYMSFLDLYLINMISTKLFFV